MEKSIAWKIDLLMRLTGTSNSELARKLGFDASYISRIRHGKRGLPSSRSFTEPACSFFAKRIHDDYQRKVVADELGAPWPESLSEAAGMLAAWLEPNPGSDESIRRAVGSLGARPPIEAMAAAPPVRTRSGHLARVRLYYGNAGKRDAVASFLAALCETGEAHTLLLHSDEDMTWLYEDAAFARQWADLLLRLIGNGGKVRIAHTLSRNADEMWEAVHKWMPLYMTGAVEPYYWPHLSDSPHRRTLFVASGHSALAASSVAGSACAGPNMLIEDEGAVSALETELEGFFASCLPLMQVTFPGSPDEMNAIVDAFIGTGAETLTSLEDGKLICARENGNALAANLESPLVAFAIEEPHMAAALWSYLQEAR